MSIDLILLPSCGGCGSAEGLYGSACKHLTLCVSCGKSMAEKRSKCDECGNPIIRLIREYNVRANPSNGKNYFIGRFSSGLPTFKKNNENKWSIQKEGLLGHQVTDALRERFKNRPWLLEDETGQFRYHGCLEGTQAATYYILMLRRKELVAIPVASWYNFNKVPKYKQLTLEEAEEKMKNRSKSANGCQQRMVKAALSGAAAFGRVEKVGDQEGAGGGERGRIKTIGDDDEAKGSDSGEKDEEEETARKSGDDDDDEEGARDSDFDIDDDDLVKGDDWEYEEIFTDDDQACTDELEELDTEYPEIKQDDEDENEDEDEADEEEGWSGLSKSGKEMMKLLGRANRIKDFKAEKEGDVSCMLTSKKGTLKVDTVDNSISPKATTSTVGRAAPSTSKSSKGKGKRSREESKPPNGSSPLKKEKTENENRKLQAQDHLHHKKKC